MHINPKVRILSAGGSVQFFTIWCVDQVLRQRFMKVVVPKDNLGKRECTCWSAMLNQDRDLLDCFLLHLQWVLPLSQRGQRGLS